MLTPMVLTRSEVIEIPMKILARVLAYFRHSNLKTLPKTEALININLNIVFVHLFLVLPRIVGHLNP